MLTDINENLMIFRLFALCSSLSNPQVTIFLCSGWLIILLTIFPIYMMLMMSDDRHVMAVCWFRRVNMSADTTISLDREYYWFEVQILLTTLLTIFLPISLIVACNIRVLTIGESIDFYVIELVYPIACGGEKQRNNFSSWQQSFFRIDIELTSSCSELFETD